MQLLPLEKSLLQVRSIAQKAYGVVDIEERFACMVEVGPLPNLPRLLDTASIGDDGPAKDGRSGASLPYRPKNGDIPMETL